LQYSYKKQITIAKSTLDICHLNLRYLFWEMAKTNKTLL